VQPGNSTTEHFNIGLGDKIDLTQVLAGAPISSDLTNLEQIAKVVGSGSTEPSNNHVSNTTLDIAGPGGSARIELQGSGRVDLKDLLHHDSSILPH
jgi:hypothetical protein